jgi:hypothetical protein
MEDLVTMCRYLVVDGVRNNGRGGKKTWQECVNEDMKQMGSEDVMRRIARFRGTAFLGNV